MEATLRRGKSLIDLGFLDDAWRVFESLRPYPEAAYECALSLGIICYKRGDLNQAKIQFKHASKHEPKRFMPHYNLGVLYKDLGTTRLQLSPIKRRFN